MRRDFKALGLSLSARRAWIEMFYGSDLSYSDGVALRKESVDRNEIVKIYKILNLGRSPQGERG